MTQIAFKLVGKRNGELFSYTRSLVRTPQKYILGRTVRNSPGFGPLACFSSIETALEFFKADHRGFNYCNLPWEKTGLFVCEIEPAEIQKLWNKSYGPRFTIEHIPGAITAWSVKLLAEIPYQHHFEQFVLHELDRR